MATNYRSKRTQTGHNAKTVTGAVTAKTVGALSVSPSCDRCARCDRRKKALYACVYMCARVRKKNSGHSGHSGHTFIILYTIRSIKYKYQFFSLHFALKKFYIAVTAFELKTGHSKKTGHRRFYETIVR